MVEEQKRYLWRRSRGNLQILLKRSLPERWIVFYKERCLLEQPFIKDTTQTINDLLIANIAKIGENIQINRFVRFEVGEC